MYVHSVEREMLRNSGKRFCVAILPDILLGENLSVPDSFQNRSLVSAGFCLTLRG